MGLLRARIAYSACRGASAGLRHDRLTGKVRMSRWIGVAAGIAVVLSAGAAAQRLIPGAVAVGGTAAAGIGPLAVPGPRARVA